MISVKSLIVFTSYATLASCVAQYLVVDWLQHLLFLQNLVIIKTFLNVRTCFTVCRSVLLVVASQVNTRLRSFLVSNESHQLKKNMNKRFAFLLIGGRVIPQTFWSWFYRPQKHKKPSPFYIKCTNIFYSLKLKIPSLLFQIQREWQTNRRAKHAYSCPLFLCHLFRFTNLA